MASGHQRISYIAGWKGLRQRDRQAGFVDALIEKGHRLWSHEIGNFVMGDAQKATRKLFAKGLEQGQMLSLWRMITWLLL